MSNELRPCETCGRPWPVNDGPECAFCFNRKLDPSVAKPAAPGSSGWYQAQITTLTRERDEWKTAINDAAVIDWILSDENQHDTRKIVHDLLSHAQRIALDPKVSEEAFRLTQRAETAERERDEALKKLEKIKEISQVWNVVDDDATTKIIALNRIHIIAGGKT